LGKFKMHFTASAAAEAPANSEAAAVALVVVPAAFVVHRVHAPAAIDATSFCTLATIRIPTHSTHTKP
jgi:hypothetical protein